MTIVGEERFDRGAELRREDEERLRKLAEWRAERERQSGAKRRRETRLLVVGWLVLVGLFAAALVVIRSQ